MAHSAPLSREFGVHPEVSAEDRLDHFAVLASIAGRRAPREVDEALLRRASP